MKIEWKSCLKLATAAFLFWLAITYWHSFTGMLSTAIGAAMPLIIGCIIAYIINILMTFYEKHYFPKSAKPRVVKSRRTVCMLAAFVTLVIIFVLLMKLVIPQLIECVELLVSQIPGVANKFIAWLDTKEIVPEDLLIPLQNINWKEKIEQIIGVLTTGVSSVMGTAINVVSSVFSGVVTALFALIFSIYLLTGKETLGAQFDCLLKRYMKERVYTRTRYVLSVLNDSFHKYIVGQCLEAVILGGLCMVGMWIFRFPYAAMTGAVIAFTALIPVAGGYIGAAVGAFMILTVSPAQALLFLVYIVILQQLENNLIYPKVVGSSMGLPAIWVLAAVTIGGGIMGIAGMLIGVPIASALYRLLREDVYKPLDSENNNA